jgi:hypothetical protein
MVKKIIYILSVYLILFCGITVFAEKLDVKYDCLSRTVDVTYQAEESATITFKMECIDTDRICGLFEKITDEENKAVFNIILPESAAYGDYCVTLRDSASNELYEEHFTHRQASSDCEIISFSIKGEKALISGENIILTLPYGTDLKRLVPVFETAGTAYVGTEEQISGKSIIDLTEPKIYTIIAEDGTKKSYQVEVDVEPKKQSGGSSGGSYGSIITYLPPAETPEVIDNESEETKEQYSESCFVDVPDSHWAYTVIMRLKTEGIVNGVDDQHYEPERSVTYAEFLKLLVSVTRLSDKNVGTEELNGLENEWYYEYAKKAISNNIRLDNEEFSSPLTREKMAQLLYLTVQAKGITLDQDLEMNFLDEDKISQAYIEAVEVLSTSEVLHGDDEGNFRPKDTLSRAEAAVVIDYLNSTVAN